MKKVLLLVPVFVCTMHLKAGGVYGDLNPTKSKISFRENKGQVSDQNYKARPDVLFSGTDGELVFHLKKDGISYQLNRVDTWKKKEADIAKEPIGEKLVPGKQTIYRLDVNWLNTSSASKIVSENPLTDHANFYLASCPEGALQVKSYEQVTYKNIYPGIDLKWYEKNGSLKYDYLVSANTNYKQIQFELKGAEKISVDSNGELLIQTPLGTLKEQKPFVTQNGKELEANWIVNGNVISFNIKNNDPTQPIIIDPLVRLWGTYFGGAAQDYPTSCNLDGNGNIYMTGVSQSLANIASVGAHQTTFGGGAPVFGDGFIAKFTPMGALLWCTYYGGSDEDLAARAITNSSGDVYLIGSTSSSNTAVFATPGAHQSTVSLNSTNAWDGFIVKFDFLGTRIWGTFVGGDRNDYLSGITLSPAGDIYVAGTTASTNNISTPGTHQMTKDGGNDGFLSKFNSSGALQWSTYYGGPGALDGISSCATDATGNIFFSGATNSSVSISTPGVHQPSWSGNGGSDGFFGKFNSSGTLQWCTYYGGTASENAFNITVDPAGDIYINGYSGVNSGTIIATTGSHQQLSGGGIDAYLAKFDQAGLRIWSTYYGGQGNEFSSGCSLDLAGNIYISGSTSTSSGTAIATSCAYQSTYAGGSDDLFVVKFTPSGNRVWGTYFGSIYSDGDVWSTVTPSGNVYLSGGIYANAGSVISSSTAYQTNYGGGNGDAFLISFDSCTPVIPPNITPLFALKVCYGGTATLNTTCGAWYTNTVTPVVLATGSTFTTGVLTKDSTFYIQDLSCGIGSGYIAVNVTVVPLPTVTITPVNPNMCVGETITLTASGASTYSWNTTSTLTTLQFTMFLTTSYTVTGKDANGCVNTTSLHISPNQCSGINELNASNTDVLLYPNPSAGNFNVHATKEIELVITNELGQRLKSVKLSGTNNFHATIDELPNGVYFINGENADGKVNKKLIVLK